MTKKLILILLTAAAAILGASYYQVDQQVRARLRNLHSGLVPAVYSDQLRVSTGSRLEAQAIEEELVSRGYRSVDAKPSQPGEYRFDGGVLLVHTRGFVSPDGSRKEPSEAIYDTSNGQVRNLTWRDLESFYLEPRVIAPLGSAERKASRYKKLSEIPEIVRSAVVTVEDERFYSHFGIDIYGVLRALVKNIMAGALVEGGSGITQQLAKNLLFTPERTLTRKAKEALAALSLERHLKKDDILELYLNEVYLGQEGSVALHGVAEAISAFFAKGLEEADAADAALLAGIIKAPSYYSPRRHPERAEERRNLVLGKMLENGVIGRREYDAAKARPVAVTGEARYRRKAPFFTAAVEQELHETFGPDSTGSAGLSVYTGLDANLQRCAEAAVEKGLESLEKRYPRLKRDKRLEAGLVALEPVSGLVKAWVGGRDFAKNQFNHVNQASRQIGSTIKPFLYLTALDPQLNDYKTATPISVLTDKPMSVELVTRNTWEPENYDHSYRGDVTLRYALENSLNIPAVFVAQKVGIPALTSTLRKFHVADHIPSVPALSLGAADTTLLNLTASYAALANGGIYTAPRLYISVQDAEQNVLATSAIVEERAADEDAVYVLTNILQGVVERGTARNVRVAGYEGPAAGKTGTSNETRDAWFIGFTANLATGVWTGFDDNRKIGLTGGLVAAPIWAEFMKCADTFRPSEGFVPPPGVVFVELDAETGQVATSACPTGSRVKEVFIEGTEPIRACQLHGPREEGPDIERALREAKPRAPRRRTRSFWDILFGD